MMRYMISKSGENARDTYCVVVACGAGDVRLYERADSVFANVELDTYEELIKLGYTLNINSAVVPHQFVSPPKPMSGLDKYSPLDLQIGAGLSLLREITSPSLYGFGVNVAVVGTGIRSTHVLIGGRVVLSKNLTNSPDEDYFNHDTGVAGIIIQMVPLCNIIDVKIIEDNGQGTEEEAVAGIDYIIGLVDDGNEYAPDIINMSAGARDVTRNSALRKAIRQATKRGILVVASAGNDGPAARTVTSPAVEQDVVAVGSVNYESYGVSGFSSRGPTLEGAIKPDCCMFGEDIIVASSISDNGVHGKSGTSFTAPEATGLIVIFKEYMDRINQNIAETGLSFTLTPQVLNHVLMPQACQKAIDTGGKDNDIGWGILLPALSVPLFASTSSTDLISTMVTMMMMRAVAGSVT